MEASFSLGWHKQFRSNQHGGQSIALEWQVKCSPFNTAYQLIQGHVKYTQVTMTQIQDSIDKKVRRGRPSGMHELSPSSKTNKIKWKAKSDTDLWASDRKLEKCGWVCRGERTDAEVGRQWAFCAPLQIQKDESSPWHQPSSVAHSHSRTHNRGASG